QWSGGGIDLVGNTLNNTGSITLTNLSGSNDALFANNFYTGGNASSLGGTLNNTGTIIQQGAGPLTVYDKVTLSNQGSYQFTGNGSIALGIAAGLAVTNAGTLTSTAGTNTIGVPFTNTGTVTATQGANLTISSLTNTGTVTASQGANLTISSLTNYSAGTLT